MSSGKSSEFSPINPLDLTDEQSEEFFHRIRDLEKSAQFSGSRDLIRLVRERVLGVGIIIRFHDSLKPEWQMITHRGLFPLKSGNNPAVLRELLINYPFSKLDSNPLAGGRPYQWGVDGIEFTNNKEIDRLLGDVI